MFTLTGGFATPTSEVLAMRGRSWSFEQKFSRIVSAHTFKTGFRWGREGGSKTNPQNPNFTLPDDQRPAGQHAELDEPPDRVSRRTTRTWTTSAASCRTTGE